MLSNYMKSSEYYNMIEKDVDGSKEIVTLGKKFHNALDKLGLAFKTYNSIECSVAELACAERDSGYKKGFQDGAKFTVECVSSNASSDHNGCARIEKEA